MDKRFSISWKMGVSLFLCSFIPLIFLGGWFYFYTKDEFKKKAIVTLRGINESRAKDINHIIQLRHEQAKEISLDRLMVNLNGDNINTKDQIKQIQDNITLIYDRLRTKESSHYQYLDRKSDIEVIEVLDTKGQVIASSRSDSIGAYERKDLLENVKKYGKFFDGLHIDPISGNYLLVVAQAVSNIETGQFVGVLILKFNSSILRRYSVQRARLQA